MQLRAEVQAIGQGGGAGLDERIALGVVSLTQPMGDRMLVIERWQHEATSVDDGGCGAVPDWDDGAHVSQFREAPQRLHEKLLDSNRVQAYV
jgi:hypothetical protein